MPRAGEAVNRYKPNYADAAEEIHRTRMATLDIYRLHQQSADCYFD